MNADKTDRLLHSNCFVCFSFSTKKNVQIFLHIKYAENYQIAVKKLRKTNDKNNHDITSIVLLSLAETL